MRVKHLPKRLRLLLLHFWSMGGKNKKYVERMFPEFRKLSHAQRKKSRKSKRKKGGRKGKRRGKLHGKAKAAFLRRMAAGRRKARR